MIIFAEYVSKKTKTSYQKLNASIDIAEANKNYYLSNIFLDMVQKR
jgi:hypothetical protein